MTTIETPHDTGDAAGSGERLPRWELASFFPSLDSREFAVAHEALLADLGRLRTLYDEHEVGTEAVPATVEAIEAVVEGTNEVMEQVRLLGAYLYAHIAADATDDQAAAT